MFDDNNYIQMIEGNNVRKVGFEVGQLCLYYVQILQVQGMTTLKVCVTSITKSPVIRSKIVVVDCCFSSPCV